MARRYLALPVARLLRARARAPPSAALPASRRSEAHAPSPKQRSRPDAGPQLVVPFSRSRASRCRALAQLAARPRTRACNLAVRVPSRLPRSAARASRSSASELLAAILQVPQLAHSRVGALPSSKSPSRDFPQAGISLTKRFAIGTRKTRPRWKKSRQRPIYVGPTHGRPALDHHQAIRREDERRKLAS